MICFLLRLSEGSENKKNSPASFDWKTGGCFTGASAFISYFFKLCFGIEREMEYETEDEKKKRITTAIRNLKDITVKEKVEAVVAINKIPNLLILADSFTTEELVEFVKSLSSNSIFEFRYDVTNQTI